jgi:hypothetical protein
MKRFLLISTIAVAALALPAAALAKGPTAATITGPGIDAINVNGDAENGIASTFSEIVQDAGFFPAVFQPVPNPMLRTQPKVELGPRYRVRWTVPTPSGKAVIVQDVYPYAKPYAVTYTRPGQMLFGMSAQGGWYAQTADLKTALVKAGLPAKAPTSSGLSAAALGGIGFGGALVLAFAGLLAVRLRHKHAD